MQDKAENDLLGRSIPRSLNFGLMLASIGHLLVFGERVIVVVFYLVYLTVKCVTGASVQESASLQCLGCCLAGCGYWVLVPVCHPPIVN